MTKSQRKLRGIIGSNKIARAIGLRGREGRSRSRDSEQFRPSGSSQNSGSFTEHTSEPSNLPVSALSTSELLNSSKQDQDVPHHTRSLSGHSRSPSGPQSLSKYDTFDRMAQSLEAVTKAMQRLQSKNLEVLQRQRTIENRALYIGEYQKTAATKLHKSLTDLVTKMDGLENELRGMRVLWMCSRAKKSQLAMLMFSQGLLSKTDRGLAPLSQGSLTDRARALQKTCKMNPSLVVLMISSLLNLVIAVCRARMHSLPISVRRALRCVQEICKASCFVALGALWDVFREILLMIVKWLGWNIV